MIKKMFACALALCMLCSVALAQFSDGPIAKLAIDDNSYWRLLEEVNLLVNFERDNQYLCDLMGNRLSEGYMMIAENDGMIIVENAAENGVGVVKGVLGLDGSVIVPVTAADISVHEGGYVNVQNADGTLQAYGPDGILPDVVPSAIYSFDYLPEEEEQEPKADKDIDTETKLWALTDLEGNLLTDFVYDSISTYELYGSDYCRTNSEDDAEGLIAYTGEEIFPPVYEEILRIDYEAYENRGIFAAWRDDVIAFAQKREVAENAEGDAATQGTYAVTEIPLENADDVEFFGNFAFVEFDDDTYAIAWPDGKLTKLPGEDCEVYPVGDQIFFITEEEDPDTGYDFSVLYDGELNQLVWTEWFVSISKDGYLLLNDYTDASYVYDLK